MGEGREVDILISVYQRLFLTIKNLANSNIVVKSVAAVDARGM